MIFEEPAGWAQDLHEPLLPTKRAADDAWAKGVELPKSIRDKISREYDRTLEMALLHSDGHSEFDTAG